jgi:hypothetical protein
MAITIPAKGQPDWDVTLNAALVELESEIAANASTLNGVTITNAPTASQTLTATSTTQAQWSTPATPLLASNNLSDIVSTSTARSSLGLTAVATAVPGTAIDYKSVGVMAAGATTRWSDAGHTHPAFGATPVKDQGVKDWTEDPRGWGASAANDVGTVWLTRYIPGYTYTWSSVWVGIASQPSVSWTAGQNFVGVYDSTGTLIAQTADLSTQFASSVVQACNFITPITATAGNEYFIAILLNETGTLATLKATGGGSSMNGNTTAGHRRVSTIGAGLTSLPASVTLSTQSTTLLASGKGSQGYFMN